MNKRLREISVSLQKLKEKLPTSNESLNIRIHWNDDEDLSFNIVIPLNKNFKRR